MFRPVAGVDCGSGFLTWRSCGRTGVSLVVLRVAAGEMKGVRVRVLF